MSILKELFSTLNEKKVGDEEYFITYYEHSGKRKVPSRIELYTEKAYKSFEAAERALEKFKNDIGNSRDEDTDAADEERDLLDDCSITRGAILKRDHPKLFEARIVSPKVSAARALGMKNAAKGSPKSTTDTCPFEKGTPEYRAYWDGVKEHSRANPKVDEDLNEDDDCVSSQCHAQAVAKSKKEGVVQHVNKDKKTGKLYVSDWYDDDETVASYNKGKKINESLNKKKEGEQLFLVKSKKKNQEVKVYAKDKAQALDRVAVHDGNGWFTGPQGTDVTAEIIKEARSIPSWFQDGAKVKLMPEYADKDPNEVFTLKSVDTETGKGRIADDQGKGWGISYYQVYPKNKTPAIHEGYGGFTGKGYAGQGTSKAADAGVACKDMTASQWLTMLKRVEKLSKAELADAEYVSDRIQAVSSNEDSAISAVRAKKLATEITKLATAVKEADDGNHTFTKKDDGKEGRYGVKVGQVYVPADGSKNELKVLSINHASEDALVFDKVQNKERHIDLFKLAKVRYSLKESADLAKKLVRGEQGPKGLLAKLDHWLGKLVIEKDANRFLPADSAVKALKSYGFNGDQVHKIREAAAEAAQTAIARMQKKHGDAVPDKYLSKLGSSFAVFDLYLNVSEAIHKEFAALMRQLFDAKIDKMKDELVIVKEDAALQGLGKSLAGKSPAAPSDGVDVPMGDAGAEPAAAPPSDTEVKGDADDASTPAEFKVGDVVKTLVGPHKGQEHDVTKVYPDGRMDLKPKGLEGTAVKYRNGGVTAKPDQVVLAESILRGSKSLLRTITIDLAEARTAADMANIMPLSYRPAKGHKIEAYGRKGMKNTMWRKFFKDSDAMSKWCEDNDATVEGSRDLDKDELK